MQLLAWTGGQAMQAKWHLLALLCFSACFVYLSAVRGPICKLRLQFRLTFVPVLVLKDYYSYISS